MNGKEVFKRAVRAAEKSTTKVIEESGYTMADIKLLVPHQANQRIMDTLCDRLKIPYERCASVIEETGNTSSASIPLALVDAIKKNRLKAGDLVLMTGFGAGMTWGSALLKWG
jgi:3-oxoacyl-[acyl-carrier-protein] synthase-3